MWARGRARRAASTAPARRWSRRRCCRRAASARRLEARQRRAARLDHRHPAERHRERLRRVVRHEAVPDALDQQHARAPAGAGKREPLAPEERRVHVRILGIEERLEQRERDPDIGGAQVVEAEVRELVEEDARLLVDQHLAVAAPAGDQRRRADLGGVGQQRSREARALGDALDRERLRGVDPEDLARGGAPGRGQLEARHARELADRAQEGELLGVGLDPTVGRALVPEQVQQQIGHLELGALLGVRARRADLAVHDVGEADHGEARGRERAARVLHHLLLGAAGIAVLVDRHRDGTLLRPARQGEHEADRPRARSHRATAHGIARETPVLIAEVRRLPGPRDDRRHLAPRQGRLARSRPPRARSRPPAAAPRRSPDGSRADRSGSPASSAR